jgi:hypothetical protein
MFAGEAVGKAGRVGYVCASRAAEALDRRRSRRAGYFFSRLLFFSATDSSIFYSTTQLGGPVFGVACTAHPSVPFRVDGPVVCQRLLDRRRWRRGAGSNRRDHPSPVNQECIRTNCEFISSSLIATSTGKAFRTPVAQRDLAEACIGARRIR